MKNIKLIIALLILPLISCSELFDSTLTITNNCMTETVSVSYSYLDDDGISYSETVTVAAGETKDETIYDKYAYVTVTASKGSPLTQADYSYYGDDHTITMVDGDFH